MDTYQNFSGRKAREILSFQVTINENFGLGGVLAFESEWAPPFGAPLQKALLISDPRMRLDLGCVAVHGHFYFASPDYRFVMEGKPATAFLFKPISELQFSGTVPMIDVQAYAQWLSK
jgi:hypothetical protein